MSGGEANTTVLFGLSRVAVEVVGYAAGTLTTLAFVPQVVKSWRTGSTRDLSSVMLVAFTTGIVLWLLYGAAVGSLPIVLANGVTLGLSGTLFLLKLRGVSGTSVTRLRSADARSDGRD